MSFWSPQNNARKSPASLIAKGLTEYCGCLRAGKFLPLAELQIRQIAFRVEVPSLQFPLGDTIERLSSVH